MIKNWLITCILFFSADLAAQGFVATYSLANVTPSSGVTDPSPMPVVPGLIFKPIRAIGLSANSSASGRFSFSGWPLGGLDGSDTYSLFTGALSGTSYYECKIYVAPGSTLTLQSLDFVMRRSSTGIRNFSVRCDRNNFSSDLAASTGTNTKLSVLPLNLFYWKYDSVASSSDQRDLSVSFGNLGKTITDSITLRFYAWNAESSGGNFSLDNLSFSGHTVDSALLAGLPNTDSRRSVALFPNPCSTDRIYFSEEVEQLTVYDSYGRIVSRHAGSLLSCDVSMLLNGLYYVYTAATRQRLVICR